MRRLRVFHFAQDSDTSGYFPQLARFHDRDKYQMIFGTLGPIAPWLSDYMSEHHVPTFSGNARSRLQYPVATLRLFAELRRHQVDIFHAHLFDPAVVGLPTARAARAGVRILTRHHSDYHTRISKRWHVQLDKTCTRLSDAVIGVSQHTARHLIEVERAPPSKVHAVPNGIDFDRVRASSDTLVRELRRELLRGDQGILISMAGRMHPEKGYPDLFKALAIVKAKATTPWRLVICGTGPFLQAYKDEVRGRDYAGHVEFLGFRRDLPDIIAASDLFLLPSVAEAFGLAIAEALYLGTPVLSTTAGAIPEIVDHGRDGWLVPPGDALALATELLGLLGDPSGLNAMRNRGREKILSLYGFDKMVAAYESIYSDLLAARQ